MLCWFLFTSDLNVITMKNSPRYLYVQISVHCVRYMLTILIKTVVGYYHIYHGCITSQIPLTHSCSNNHQRSMSYTDLTTLSVFLISSKSTSKVALTRYLYWIRYGQSCRQWNSRPKLLFCNISGSPSRLCTTFVRSMSSFTQNWVTLLASSASPL